MMLDARLDHPRTRLAGRKIILRFLFCSGAKRLKGLFAAGGDVLHEASEHRFVYSRRDMALRLIAL
jgi:hypothetical protein